MQHTTHFTAARLAAGLLALGMFAAAMPAQRSPEEALRALQDGNRRFMADKSVPQPLGEGVRRTLARGQSPYAIVVTCADSRVSPEHLFNAGLGELFVIRVAGNTCDPEVLASIEYAAEHLQTSLCVVLGHEGCGAIAASADLVQTLEHDHAAPSPSPAMQSLLERIEPAVRRARARELGGKELLDCCEEENVHLAVGECMRRSSLLRRYAQTGKFRMVPARYLLATGEVQWLSPRPLPAQSTAQATAPQHVVPMGVPPHVALRMLQAGHRRFLGDGLPAGDLSASRREALTHGQRPLAIVLTCADSRVPPEHVFDAGLGELFVVRVAGNTLNDSVLASIEYAAAHTGTSLLVVMGHSHCGAIGAAAELAKAHGGAEDLTPSMRSLLTRLEPSVEKARGTGARGEQLVELAVRGNVLRTIAEARARSSVLRQLEEEGRLAMLASVYDIGSGDLTWLKEPTLADSTPQAMPAAPMGEAAPARRPQADSQDQHGEDHQHENASKPTVPKTHQAGHGDSPQTAAHDWGNFDVRVTEPAPVHAHGAPAPADPAQAGDHHAVDTHRAQAHGGDAHDDLAAHTHGPQPHHKERTDPIPLVGMIGIGSLLLAALIAATSRR